MRALYRYKAKIVDPMKPTVTIVERVAAKTRSSSLMGGVLSLGWSELGSFGRVTLSTTTRDHHA